jgi:hypothetical protein
MEHIKYKKSEQLSDGDGMVLNEILETSRRCKSREQFILNIADIKHTNLFRFDINGGFLDIRKNNHLLASININVCSTLNDELIYTLAKISVKNKNINEGGCALVADYIIGKYGGKAAIIHRMDKKNFHVMVKINGLYYDTKGKFDYDGLRNIFGIFAIEEIDADELKSRLCEFDGYDNMKF